MTDGMTDLFALNQAEYEATEAPRTLEVDTAWFLTVDGRGPSSGPEYARKRECLFKAAEALRARSALAGRDYAVSKLEAMRHPDPGHPDPETAPPDAWNWTLCLRTPDFIGESDLDAVVAQLRAAGGPPELRRLGLMGFDEGLCVQVLHTGSNGGQGPALAALRGFMEAQGLTVVGRQHEIYLTDPRETGPDSMRTIIRLPVI